MMKHLKMSIYLLLTAAIFTGCEKETSAIPENNNIKLEINNEDFQLNLIEAGYKIEIPESYLISKKKVNTVFGRDDNSQLVFFNDENNFNSLGCGSLNFEDFEETVLPGGGDARFTGPLNEFTDNSYISPGDIVSGVEFQSSLLSDQNLAIFGFPVSWIPYSSKYLGPNYYTQPLIINFITGAKNVGLDFVVYNYPGTSFQIDIYNNDELISSTLRQVASAASFWGVQSEILITKIIITPDNSLGNWIGIDNLSFGNCNDADGDGVLNEDDLCANTPSGEEVNSNGCAQSQLDDDNDGVLNTVDSCSNTPSGEAVNENGCGQSQLDYDNDGVMNNKDAHIYSILGGVINIGGCYPNVNNKMVKNGSTMMDQITDLIAQINSEYNGQNYKTLHNKFMTKLAQITYNWRTAKLITTTQRSQISSCAWGSNIPYYNNDN